MTPFLKPGSLVVTLSSVQAQPIGILKNTLPENCSYLGCHPLFGSTITTPAGQIIALCDANEQNNQHSAFQQLLTKNGLIVTTLQSEEHDRYMSYIQALTHFCLLGFAATLVKDRESAPPSELLKLRTPNFLFLYAFACRVLKITPTTTGAIQSTAEAKTVRESLLQSLSLLHARFNTSDAMSCAHVIGELGVSLTGPEVFEGAEIAAVAVDSLQSFDSIFHRHMQTGHAFIFHHRGIDESYNRKKDTVRIARVIAIGHDYIRFEESTKVVERTGKKMYAICHTDTAKKNYRKIGISARPFQFEVKKRNIKLLSQDELEDFHRNQVLPLTVDFVFSNPFNLSENYFEDWLPKVVLGLRECEFLRSTRYRGEAERVALRLTFNPNTDRDDLVKRVRVAVEEQQLTLRSREASQKRAAS